MISIKLNNEKRGADMSFKWICPFCNVAAIIEDTNYHERKADFVDIQTDNKIVVLEMIECPNPDCNNYTLTVLLNSATWFGTARNKIWRPRSLIKKWDLIPSSRAKVFPNYIPKPILDDYKEACLIKDLSPKASATLSRRSLQGMIRDFWKVKKSRLIDEIEAIKDKVEPLTWEAIDSVRKVGNIGAHMEKDINLIIEVEPNEANLLVSLIETLIKDWYINRHNREEKLKDIVALGKQKESQKKQKK